MKTNVIEVLNNSDDFPLMKTIIQSYKIYLKNFLEEVYCMKTSENDIKEIINLIK